MTAASKGIQVKETRSVTQDTKALRGVLEKSGTSELMWPLLMEGQAQWERARCTATCWFSPFYTPSPGVSLGLRVPFNHLQSLHPLLPFSSIIPSSLTPLERKSERESRGVGV